jgi:hypothetical protein
MTPNRPAAVGSSPCEQREVGARRKKQAADCAKVPHDDVGEDPAKILKPFEIILLEGERQLRRVGRHALVNILCDFIVSN